MLREDEGNDACDGSDESSDEKTAFLGSRHSAHTRQPCCQTRHVLAFISFLGFSIVYALRVNLSVAMVVMVNHTSSSETTNSKVCPVPWHNVSQPAVAPKGPQYNWDSKTQGWILGAFFYGYIVTQIPGGYLADRYGGKLLFGLGITCTWLFTLLTPIAAEMGVFYLILVRFLEGLGEGVTFPTMHAMWAKWAPPLERSQLISFSYAGSYFGTVVALPLSGVLADTLGWPYIFYICGSVGVFWSLGWYLLAFDSPKKHPYISAIELKYIQSSLHSTQSSQKPQRVPWLEMSRSGPVWAICISYFCYSWGFYTLLNCMPMYMNDILHFSIEENGFLSALPYLFSWVVMVGSGLLADWLCRRKVFSTTTVRKMFTLFGLGGPSLFLIAVCYVGCNSKLAVTFLTLSLVAGALSGSGNSINHLDIAPQFAGILLGISNSFATIPGFLAPLAVGYLTSNHTLPEWQNVFYIASAVSVFGAVFFMFFGSGKIQKWATLDSIPCAKASGFLQKLK
uniref:sialin-like isoform X2 n=1 Tax=Myxine glutinosa TaxID=7769 RepID=UPI00358F7DEC